MEGSKHRTFFKSYANVNGRWISPPAAAKTLFVYPIQMALWMIRRTLVRPLGLLWVASCIASVPILILFTPHGLLDHDAQHQGFHWDLGSMAALAGSGLAMAALDESRWILDQASGLRRWLAGWSALVASALMGWILVGLSAWTLSGSAPNPSAPLLLGALLECVHLAVVASLILQLPVRASMRPPLFLLLVWVLPSLLGGDHPAIAWGIALFQVPGRDSLEGVLLTSELLTRIGPIVLLSALQGLLLTSRPIPSHHLDEVRRPR
ncbi:MAG: hypothetical protein ACI9K5_003691 [Gammaproteobacteria bacterium]|jgi:hypothetical protein